VIPNVGYEIKLPIVQIALQIAHVIPGEDALCGQGGGGEEGAAKKKNSVD
jgi:hypothetical protein